MKSLAAVLGILTLLLADPIAHADPLRMNPPDPLGGTGGGTIAGSVHVRVVHAGTTDPVGGAFVMLGTMPGAYFPANYGFASPDGEITFSSAALHGPIMVTATAPGHRAFTIDGIDASDLVLPLSPLANDVPLYDVGDAVSGIDVNNGAFHYGDGNLDMALVLPALQMGDLLTFDAAGFFGAPDTIDVLGTAVAVPSNCYIPQQWELFIEIVKARYGLRLPAGAVTLAAVSGRIPNDAILSGAPMEELLASIQWRETDILNVTVTGDMTTADLNVDPDLVSTVTLNLANVPDGSTAYCLSLGDLDNLSGLGRLVPLGMSSLACPAGSGACAGSVALTTTAATGEFSGMGYFPAVAVTLDSSEDALVLLSRGPHPQSYTETMGSFFRPLDLGYSDGRFAWSDAENPAGGSPRVHVQQAVLHNAAGDSILWEFLLPGAAHDFIPPTLPPSAPHVPAAGALYRWEQRSIGLGYDLPTFDFDAFPFSAIVAHASHIASDEMDVLLSYPAAAIGDPTTDRRISLGIQGPNPGRDGAVFLCTLDRAGAAELSISTADGRLVAIPSRGVLAAGAHSIRWSGRDEGGRPLASGIYFARLKTDFGVATTRVLLLR
jgi:hypothetical protein